MFCEKLAKSNLCICKISLFSIFVGSVTRRVLRVRLKRDDDVYSRNITVENATHVVSFDSSRAYRGYVEGNVSGPHEPMHMFI